MTIDEYKAFSRQRKSKANKYHALPTGQHASRKEGRRARELRIMEKAGIIRNLREQVRYELIPNQYGTCGSDFKGREVKVLIEKKCSYVADFVYEDHEGNTVVEDTKGFRTKDYIIKRKLMLARYGIRIREI